MYFKEEDVEKMKNECAAIPERHQALMNDFLKRRYQNERAREFAHNGFLRRLKTLARCIGNVFDLLPPDLEGLPDNDRRHDAEINLQAHVINAFGCHDNLAWIWVKEKNITKANGSPVPDRQVGLRKVNTIVRGSFSCGFQQYLESRDPWFDYLDSFRHALAHRIPLYIPPYTLVGEANHAAAEELEIRKMEALRRWDFQEYDRLTGEQDALGVFRPWMQHSFGENAKPAVFHPQLLTDFNTVEEMARKVLEELD